MSRRISIAILAALFLAPAGLLPAGEEAPPAAERLVGDWAAVQADEILARLVIHANRTLVITWDDGRAETRRYNLLEDRLYAVSEHGTYLTLGFRFEDRQLVLEDRGDGSVFRMRRQGPPGEAPEFTPLPVPEELVGDWDVIVFDGEGRVPFRRLELRADGTGRTGIDEEENEFFFEAWPEVLLLRDEPEGEVTARILYSLVDEELFLTRDPDRETLMLEREGAEAEPETDDLLREAWALQARVNETEDPAERRRLREELMGLQRQMTLPQIEAFHRGPPPAAGQGQNERPGGVRRDSLVDRARELRRQIKETDSPEERQRLERELQRLTHSMTLRQLEEFRSSGD